MKNLRLRHLMVMIAFALLSIIPARAQQVLIIWDVDNANTQSLKSVLENAGMTVTMSATSETGYDGTNPSLADFDAVIHLNGTTPFVDMPAAGQTALVDFVTDGGGYIQAEWDAYEYLNGRMSLMRDLILFDRVSGALGTYTVTTVPAQASHPVVASVSSPFSLSATWNVGSVHTFVTDPCTVLATDQDGNDAVAVREFEDGRIVGFNHAGNYGGDATLSDANIQQLYINAIYWSAGYSVAFPVATVTLSDLTHVYNGLPQGVTATTDPSGLTVEITYSQDGNPVASPTNVGSYDVTATIDDETYTGSTTGTMTIEPAELTITADDKTWQCGGASPTLTGVVVGAQNGETFTEAYTTTATASSPLGDYPITPSIDGATITNYTVTIVEGTLSIYDDLDPVPDIATLPEITAQCSATITTVPTATDQCFGVIAATTADPLSYTTQGVHVIHWSYDDGHGNVTVQEQTVTITDTDLPTLSVTLSPTTIWPPNNSMRTITVSIGTTDNCSTPTWVLTSVVGDDGTVDGDISAALGTAATSFQVRAKRTGGGSGRTYTATFTATDAVGNQQTATATVFVPHDQSGKRTAGVTTGSPGLSSLSVPNPFTTMTEIRYHLAIAGEVKVSILDMKGEEVARLVDGTQSAGDRSVIWNATAANGAAVAAGTYIYLIETGGTVESGKIVLER